MIEVSDRAGKKVVEGRKMGIDTTVTETNIHRDREEVLPLGYGFIRDSIDDCWEPWMKIADEILDDEELIEPVYEALRRVGQRARRTGEGHTEVALRMLALNT